jgi:hypothetical protein
MNSAPSANFWKSLGDVRLGRRGKNLLVRLLSDFHGNGMRQLFRKMKDTSYFSRNARLIWSWSGLTRKDITVRGLV